MSQSRQFRDDPNSYRKTGIPRGNVQRYGSQDVLRMGGQKAQVVELEPVETEARKELRQLAKRQADTDITLSGTLSKKKQFTGGSLHQPLKTELHGQLSLSDYQTIAERDEQYDELRMLGLNEEEILFKLQHEAKESSKECKVSMNPSIIQQRLDEINTKIRARQEYFKEKDKFKPHKTLTRHEMDLEKSLVPNDPMSKQIGHLLIDSEHGTKDQEPNEITELLKEITDRTETEKKPEMVETEKKPEMVETEKPKCVRCQQVDILIKYGHRDVNDTPVDCSECQYLQRVQISVTDSNVTASAVVSSAVSLVDPSSFVSTVSSTVPPPSSVTLSSTTSSTLSTSNFSSNQSSSLSKNTATNPTDKKRIDQHPIMGPLKKGQLAPWTKHEEIEEVPERILERFRLTLDEIKMIPKFANYSPGEPSKTLFLKNLSAKVTEHDLVSVFRRYEAAGAVSYRLCTGRMKGQAFISLPDVETASKALKLVNGYMLKDKPIIIQYGKRS